MLPWTGLARGPLGGASSGPSRANGQAVRAVDRDRTLLDNLAQTPPEERGARWCKGRLWLLSIRWKALEQRYTEKSRRHGMADPELPSELSPTMGLLIGQLLAIERPTLPRLVAKCILLIALLLPQPGRDDVDSLS